MKITKKTLTLIIIIIAAVAIIILGIIYGERIIHRLTRGEPVTNSHDRTVIECNVGQFLSDADLKEVENIVRNIASDKFISAEKTEGHAPILDLETRGYDVENMSDEEYEQIRRDIIGDRLVVICLPLTEDEWLEIYTAIAFHFEFEFTNDALHNRAIRNLFGAD